MNGQLLAQLCHAPGLDPLAGDTRRLADQFLSPEFHGPRFLLGRNAHSAALLQCMNIDGIVDDYAAGHSWHEQRVVKSDELPKNAIVVNCSMSISPLSAYRRLQKHGLHGCIYYADLYRARPDLIPAPFFVADTQEDVAENEHRWISLFEKMSDASSKRVLSDLLGYRLSADPRHMTDYSVRMSDQYFEDFLCLDREVFVDAGGYNGDTTEEFSRRYPNYRQVILFEPSSINMRDAKRRLADIRDVEYIEKGLSNAIGSLWFNPDAGSASAVMSNGSCRIDVTTLDASVSEPVSFIKMDLEGWELKALEGSRGHILADHPKLAISVYHAASDFWRIPEYIASIRQDYDIHLRHYTEGWSETVMFFVPQRAVR